MAKEIINNYDEICEAQNGNEQALSDIIKKNIGLIYSITFRFKDRGYDIEDLNQLGIIGFIKAIKKFQPKYNVKLSTYAVPFIIGEVKRFIRDDGLIKISRSIKELSYKISVLQKEYLSKYGKELKISELEKNLNVSKEEVLNALDIMENNNVLSINSSIRGDCEKDICLEDTLMSNKNEELEITNKITVHKLLDELNEVDRRIIELRYFENKTQTEISKVLGISQVQISRLEKKILGEMRRKIV